MEVVKLWLNGNKDYYTGLVLYIRHGSNDDLKDLFRTGPTDFNVKRLEKEMKLLLVPQEEKKIEPKPERKPVIEIPADDLPVVNAPLYEVARGTANMAYKEAMNLRAEVFALARIENWEDCNRPDKIQQRSKMCIDVVQKYNQASALYESADFARTHGRLETTMQEMGEDYADLPDHLVKHTLANVRKNRNKLRKREVTPERTELLQKHEANILKLEERWQLLQAGT